jgi:hypothetical protein
MRMGRDRWAALAVAGALALALGGCGDDEDAVATAPATSAGDARLVAPPDGTSPASGQMLAASGLSVEEALADSGGEPLVVRAFIVVAPDGAARLCDALAESSPPQCGGASMPVTGLPPEMVDGLETREGVRWSEGPVQLIGSVRDGSFVNDPLALAAS